MDIIVNFPRKEVAWHYINIKGRICKSSIKIKKNKRQKITILRRASGYSSNPFPNPQEKNPNRKKRRGFLGLFPKPKATISLSPSSNLLSNHCFFIRFRRSIESMSALKYLESQRNAHPELADWYNSLSDLYLKKLWHQLTLKLEEFVSLAVFQVPFVVVVSWDFNLFVLFFFGGFPLFSIHWFYYLGFFFWVRWWYGCGKVVLFAWEN